MCPVYKPTPVSQGIPRTGRTNAFSKKATTAIFVFTCHSGPEDRLSLFYDEVIGSAIVESDWHGHGNTKACFNNRTVSFGQDLSLTISQVLQGCVRMMLHKGLSQEFCDCHG